MDTRLIHSVRVFRLRGTRAERARQHGEFVRGLDDAGKRTLAFSPLSKKKSNPH